MTTLRLVRLALASALVGLLAACAHPISISPESTPPRVEGQLIQKKVAYAISDADLAKEVISPGGGGDRVSYYPHRDLEKAMRDALRSVYQDVVAIGSPTEPNGVSRSGVDLVFIPEVKTTSSSPSPFTWPPTRFTSEISCLVTDADGVELTRVRAIGEGNAEFDEFKSNFSLAANRAGTDLAAKLVQEIRGNEKLR